MIPERRSRSAFGIRHKRINEMLYGWITTQNRNPFVIGPITFLFPTLFLESIYNWNNERRLWNGKNACFTLSFDCDYPEDVEALPAIVEVLSRYSLKASFACVGAWIERYPEIHLKVLEHGHEIVNHTYSHPDNELLNPGRRFREIPRYEKRREIEKCHEICRKLLGYEPTGCRIPHFKNLFTTEIYGILKELGYAYSSSTWLTGTVSHGLPFLTPEQIVEFPVSVCPLHPFTVFDTWHSLKSKKYVHRLIHNGPDHFIELLNKLVHLGVTTGSYLNIYIDPADIKNLYGFESVLDRLSAGDIVIETYEGYLRKGLHVEL